jgi:hypothetical protein
MGDGELVGLRPWRRGRRIWPSTGGKASLPASTIGPVLIEADRGEGGLGLVARDCCRAPAPRRARDGGSASVCPSGSAAARRSGAGRAAGAGDVLDDDLLVERAAHMVAEQTRDRRRWDRRPRRARSGRSACVGKPWAEAGVPSPSSKPGQGTAARGKDLRKWAIIRVLRGGAASASACRNLGRLVLECRSASSETVESDDSALILRRSQLRRSNLRERLMRLSAGRTGSVPPGSGTG